MDYKTIDGYVATFFPYDTKFDTYMEATKEATISMCEQIVERKVPYTVNGTVIGRAIHAKYGENGVTIFIELNCDGRELFGSSP